MSLLFRLLCVLVFLSGGGALAQSFDLGVGISTAAVDLPAAPHSGAWLRLRGMSQAPMSAGSAELTAKREELRSLRLRGYRLAALLRWDNKSWPAGTRDGGGHRFALDLREVYERCRGLAFAYGDLIDAWEIDNEPDGSFGADNPETYTAFLKAAHGGIHDGTYNESDEGGRDLDMGAWRLHVKGLPAFDEDPPSFAGTSEGGDGAPGRRRIDRASSLVLMAPMSQPPGPYFERMLANGLLSHTDGFNYHFYGYAEDFSDVYYRYEEAVTESGREKQERREKTKTRRLPVFLTEFGYGGLDKEARDTVEGRVRQWAWFREAETQAEHLGIEGPMAFYLASYLELNFKEFGLLFPRAADNEEPVHGTHGEPEGDVFKAGGLAFRPEDFGTSRARPWMQEIGRKIGGQEASPALAWLLGHEREQSRKRSWKVRVSGPSPVVIDFVAGEGMKQEKDFRGYWVGEAGPSASKEVDPGSTRIDPHGSNVKTARGRGTVVLYNFSDQTTTGRLVLPAGWDVERGESPASGLLTEETGAVITLEPMERREVPVAPCVPGERFEAHEAEVSFLPKGEIPSARFSTLLYPNPAEMETEVVSDFRLDEPAPQNADAVAAVKRADGEPGLRARGDWFVTDGVKVSAFPGGWRFEVDRFPAEPIRPAKAELPVSADFNFEPNQLLLMQYRLGDAGGLVSQINSGAPAANPNQQRATSTEPKAAPIMEGSDSAGEQASALGGSDPRYRTRTGTLPSMMEVGFRTENGNVYNQWPPLFPTTDWRWYRQIRESFWLTNYSRARPPWRFAEGRPISLVFYFRPKTVPAVFEVRSPVTARWRAPEAPIFKSK